MFVVYGRGFASLLVLRLGVDRLQVLWSALGIFMFYGLRAFGLGFCTPYPPPPPGTAICGLFWAEGVNGLVLLLLNVVWWAKRL